MAANAITSDEDLLGDLVNEPTSAHPGDEVVRDRADGNLFGGAGPPVSDARVCGASGERFGPDDDRSGNNGGACRC